MRFSKGLIAILVLSTVLPGSAVAKSQKPKLTMEQARTTALAKHRGTIKSGELEKEHGKLVYSFDIQTSEGIREVQVDAMTGEIVEDKVESAAEQAQEAAQGRQNSNQPTNRKKAAENHQPQ